MLHITGSCVEFYKFFKFFSGKTDYFYRPHPILARYSRIYRRFC